MVMFITGLGTAVPEHHAEQLALLVAGQDLCCDSDQQRGVMKLIYEGSGVQQRSSVLLKETLKLGDEYSGFYTPRQHPDDRGPTTQDRMQKFEEHALQLALQSCSTALAQADQDVSEITHLVTVSCSGFQAPGFDVGLIQRLGLPADTARTHVGFMGCHGAFNALRVAKAFVDSDPEAVVLMCSVELCSLHHHYGWSTEKVVANALFADGSGAAVCRQAVDDRAETSGLSRTNRNYQLIHSGSHLLPKTLNAMTWRIGDHGFEMTLSQKLPALIEENLQGWLLAFLKRERLTVQDIRGWAIHPGGPRILDACRNSLSLPEEALQPAREILSRYGNMSSATVLFLLEQLQQSGQEGPIVALGFGPGLTIEAMLMFVG